MALPTTVKIPKKWSSTVGSKLKGNIKKKLVDEIAYRSNTLPKEHQRSNVMSKVRQEMYSIDRPSLTNSLSNISTVLKSIVDFTKPKRS